jgi:hypothetical protein
MNKECELSGSMPRLCMALRNKECFTGNRTPHEDGVDKVDVNKTCVYRRVRGSRSAQDVDDA